MRRWEAFDLAARIEAAETRYALRAIRLRRARDEHHEVLVEDTRSGIILTLRSPEEWRDAVGLSALRRLARRARWAEGNQWAREDLVAEYLVAEYQRLSEGLGLDVPPRPGTAHELQQAVEALAGALLRPLSGARGG
jgi:hypothetical protein